MKAAASRLLSPLNHYQLSSAPEFHTPIFAARSATSHPSLSIIVKEKKTKCSRYFHNDLMIARNGTLNAS
jgi:hypothetical protein